MIDGSVRIDAALLRRDLRRIAPQAGAAGLRFVAHLARLDPALAARLVPSTHAAVLLDLLHALCDGADDASALRHHSVRLGRAHAALGLREDDYDPLGTALLITLHDVLGEGFGPEAEEAWAATYGALAEGMIAACVRAAPD